MACDLTSGFELDCRDSIGGIRNIYILSGSVTTVNGDDVGLISGLTGSGVFYQFELPRQAGDYTETINVSDENGTVFYEQVVNAPFHRMQSSIRNQVKVLAQNPDVKLIVETNNGADDNIGTFFYVGQRHGAMLSGGTGASGTAYGDLNGYTLTFTGREPYPASEINAADGLAARLEGITVG